MRGHKGGADGLLPAICCQDQFTGCPQELSRTCGPLMWTNRWTTSGQPGDDRGTTWENSGGIHAHPSPVHTQRTPPVHKNELRTGKTPFSPESTAPYYYYVLITQ